MRAGEVEPDRPVVHVVVDRLRPEVVGVAREPAPVDVVEVFAFRALAHAEDDPVGEVGGKVPLRPVDAVLLRLQRLACVASVAVLVLARRLVGGPDPPDLGARALGRPFEGQWRRIRRHDDVVLDEPPENPVSVHCEAISARLDHWDFHAAGAGVDIGPVL